MTNEIVTALDTLSRIREAWAKLPRPNVEIPGFDYDEVTRLVRETQNLSGLKGNSQKDYAELLLSKVVIPNVDVSDPSQAGLILFHQLVSMERALVLLAPPRVSEDLEIDMEKYKDDISEIRRIADDLKAALPVIERQAELVRDEVQKIRLAAENEAKKNTGINSVQLSLSGPSISIGVLRDELKRLSSATKELVHGHGVRRVEGALSRILRWAQESFSRVAQIGQSKSRFDLSASINKVGQKAAGALLIAKRIILSSLKKRKEVSVKAVAGAFSDKNYAIEYHLTEENRLYLEQFVAASRGNGVREAIVEKYLNPSVTSWSSSLQSTIFEVFKLKHETTYVAPLYWSKYGKFDGRRIQSITQAVEDLLGRISDPDHIGWSSPTDALKILGFGPEENAFGKFDR
jgi:hypothetical protein